jgi:hypothetical protein
MWQGQSITTWWGDLGYACRIQTTKVVASSSLSSTTCTKWQVWIDLCARKRKWRDPLFPGQSSSQLQSAAFCCFFFLFSMASRNTTYSTGSGSKHAWEVSGNIKMQRRSKGRQTEMCVCMCHLYLCGSGLRTNCEVDVSRPASWRNKAISPWGFCSLPHLFAPTVLSCNHVVAQCFHFIQSMGWMLSHKGMSRQWCKSNVFQLSPPKKCDMLFLKML